MPAAMGGSTSGRSMRLSAMSARNAAHGATLHRFQQKTQRPGARDLEEGRYRRFKVGDQRGPDDLGLAARIAFGKRRPLRLDLHKLLHRSVYAVAGTTADHLVQRALIDGHPDFAFELGDIFGEKSFGEATVERLHGALGVFGSHVHARHDNVGYAEHDLLPRLAGL